MAYKTKQQKSEYDRQRYRQQRMYVLQKINPSLKCCRCGCDDIRLIEINHKNGGGCKELRDKKYNDMRAAIISHNRPTDDLELTCRPCNHLHYLEMKLGESIPMVVVWNGGLP